MQPAILDYRKIKITESLLSDLRKDNELFHWRFPENVAAKAGKTAARIKHPAFRKIGLIG